MISKSSPSPNKHSKLMSNYSSIRNRFLRFGKRFQRFWMNKKQYYFISDNVLYKTFSCLVFILGIFLAAFIFVCCFGSIWPTSSTPSTFEHELRKPLSNSPVSNIIINNGDGNEHIKQSNQVNESASHVSESSDHGHHLGIIKNQADQNKKDEGFRLYSFNSLVSERLGLFRENLPDTRHRLCRNQTHNTSNDVLHNDHDDLKDWKTTVIICFFNEEFHTLIRTINSILFRTNRQHLQQILLMDDFSDYDIETKLHEYNKSDDSVLHPDFRSKVRYVRLPERSGLIRCRNYGAQRADGRVLFFLDSHCEVNVNWLPPILERIKHDQHIVACPIIDLIDPDTFKYKPSPMVKGGFNWALHFKWDTITHEQLENEIDFIKPIKSPAMAGGLFAIERNYFFHLGKYDSGMNIWGGENIEFSLRIWMCGGQLEIIPCSRVGHIFRKRRPYDSPDGQDTLAYNSLRVAHVWLDDYKRYHLETRSDLSTMDYGNIQPRLDLRFKQLKCEHDFKWYLHNIYPELMLSIKQTSNATETGKKSKINPNLFVQHKQPKVLNKYLIQLNGTNLCLQAQSELSYKNQRLQLDQCSPMIRRQIWKQTQLDELRMGNKGCLNAWQHKSDMVNIQKCHMMGSTQKWILQTGKQTLYNEATGTCLAVKTNQHLLNTSTSYKIVMSFCDQQESSDTKESNFHFIHWNFIHNKF